MFISHSSGMSPGGRDMSLTTFRKNIILSVFLEIYIRFPLVYIIIRYINYYSDQYGSEISLLGQR
jgi:hypothetical protein